MRPSTQKPRLRREDFYPLRAVLEERIGLDIGADQAPHLEERLGERVAALGLPHFGAYIDFLEGRGNDGDGDGELSSVVEALTPAESYFFRNSEQVNLLSQVILPALAASGARRLRLWSAGCSTGEEPYTLTMLLDRSKRFEDWDVSVIGTDLCDSRLRHATRARYSGGALRAIEPEKLPQWFEQRATRWAVTARIRQRTRFQKLNLLHHSGSIFLTGMDVVLCRNVLIYLTPAARTQVLRTLCSRLRVGGYLLLGHSETAGVDPRELCLEPIERGLAYRKLERPAASESLSTRPPSRSERPA